MVILPGKDRDVGEVLVKTLQNTKYSIDEKLEQSFINLFSRKRPTSLEDKCGPEGAPVKGNDQHKLIPLNHDEHMVYTGASESVQDKGKFQIADNEDLDSDESDEEEGAGDGEQSSPLKSDLKEEIEFHGGRVRRRAVSTSDFAHGDLEVPLKKKKMVWRYLMLLSFT